MKRAVRVEESGVVGEARSPEDHGAAEEGWSAGELAEAPVGHQHQPH